MVIIRPVFVEQELRIDLDRYQADVHLIFDSGPRYRFGEVRISEGHLDDDVMRRFIGFESGDLITSNELLMLQLGMSDSDYFSRVEVQPLWGEADEEFQVPVIVEYEPTKERFIKPVLVTVPIPVHGLVLSKTVVG